MAAISKTNVAIIKEAREFRSTFLPYRCIDALLVFILQFLAFRREEKNGITASKKSARSNFLQRKGGSSPDPHDKTFYWNVFPNPVGGMNIKRKTRRVHRCCPRFHFPMPRFSERRKLRDNGVGEKRPEKLSPGSGRKGAPLLTRTSMLSSFSFCNSSFSGQEKKNRDNGVEEKRPEKLSPGLGKRGPSPDPHDKTFYWNVSPNPVGGMNIKRKTRRVHRCSPRSHFAIPRFPGREKKTRDNGVEEKRPEKLSPGLGKGGPSPDPHDKTFYWNVFPDPVGGMNIKRKTRRVGQMIWENWITAPVFSTLYLFFPFLFIYAYLVLFL
ncbi:hypothetical protein CDAR_176211 [Caerostris darwini]|uniref:Uncharacterized protein n=1 Tax=Caerostris darwini TaxID=1538125 RepID=A0AAV4NX35_9ARAC|nr:hypothetical protein CDAR_176211 [Caerostris darwini]